MPSLLEHSPLLLKNGVFPSGLLVGVVNEYDLQRTLRSSSMPRLQSALPLQLHAFLSDLFGKATAPGLSRNAMSHV